MTRFLLGLFLMTSHAFTADLGTFGQTFEVREESLLDVIMTRLEAAKESGKLDTLTKNFENRVKESIQEPKGSLLPRARVGKVSHFDPSIYVENPILDHEGTIVVAAGTRLNPLSLLSWGAPLIFIDGYDSEQVSWALAQHRANDLIKITLTRGRPLEIEEEKGVPVYFDQGSVLVNKFAIKSLPARVSQDGLFLKIEELVIEKKGEK